MSHINFRFHQDLNLDAISFGGASKSDAEVKEVDNLDKLHNDIRRSPNDLTKWDKLFQSFERTFTVKFEGKPDKVSTQFKLLVTKTYASLLSRFPYLASYWKSWSIFAFKLSGTKESIEVLEKSVIGFPYSVELWTDYISALILTYGNDPEKLSFIRAQYSEALRLNGLNFLSHPLWDKVIEFETGIGEKSVIVGLYLRVTKIPLYQYAQYYNSFTQINKNYDITDVIPSLELAEYVKRFNKTDVTELTLGEKNQVVDDHTDIIFTSTQEQVTDKWSHESSIFIHDFSLDRLDEIAKEKEIWIKYLDHEISKYKVSSAIDQFDNVANIFERALVPNYYNEGIWLKYLAFINISELEDEVKYEKAKAIYLRAISGLPVESTVLRSLYPKFLMKYKHLDIAKSYLYDYLKLFGGRGNRYFKSQYLQTVQDTVEVWEKSENSKDYLAKLQTIVDEYFSLHNAKSIKKDSKGVKGESADALFVLNLLNDEAITIITVAYLKELYAQTDSVSRIREMFNLLYKENAFKKSVLFWKYFLNFERLHGQTLHNLRMIINYVKTETQLPKAIVDAFITIEYDIIGANLDSAVEQHRAGVPRSSLEDLIKNDMETSLSLIHNASARKRLANSNYIVKDAEDLKSAHKTNFNREAELLKITRKHIGHPGILIEAIPDITNKFMKEGNDVSLLDSKLVVPSFPTFKNAEKANASINYPKA
ncbi:hypothetical protein G9P44_003216 [Scheffersomyces stipitis]|nr:hypothetical protein G9P44_003216 [Scheffersomyces stipitis]